MTSIPSNGGGISSALSSSILAIQNTQSQIDQVQLRLATGLRVNSALDNPSSYFTSRSLNSRAASLNSALDNIVEKLGTINQANTAITSLQSLISDANGIAEDAEAVYSGSTLEARITGSRSLTNITNLTTVSGITANDRIRFRFIDSTGATNTANSVTITAGQSVNTFMNNINAIADAGSQVFQATLNSSGQLTINRTANTRWDLQFETNAGAANTQLAAALGFSGFSTTNTAANTAETRITVLPTPSLTSISLFAVGGTAAQTTTSLRNTVSTSAAAIGDIFNGDANDTIKIGINGGSYVTVTSSMNTDTMQTLLDGINNNASLNTYIAASFNSGTSQLNIRAIDDSVTSIQIQIVEDAAAAGTIGKVDMQKLGFGTRILQSNADGNSRTSSESFELNAVAASLAGFEVEFNAVRDQIDELVADSEFDGVNLLDGDDLTTSFNTGGSSSLVTEGETLTSLGLGISAANFGTSSSTSTAASETSDATDQVERFATSLSNDISIIETRQDFMQETINLLNSSSDDLTSANQNEDGALLLSLQTKLLLGVTGLALGSQAQASTLRLF